MSDRDSLENTPTMPDLLQAGLELQGQGIALLLAEVQALATLLPGHQGTHPTEAETEAEQDNMPV